MQGGAICSALDPQAVESRGHAGQPLEVLPNPKSTCLLDTQSAPCPRHAKAKDAGYQHQPGIWGPSQCLLLSPVG